MQANISLQMNKIKKYKKRRYLNDNGVKIVLLVVSFPDLGNRNASDAPIISIDFIDNDNSRLFVFTEHVVQQIGSTFYQGLFLLWCQYSMKEWKTTGILKWVISWVRCVSTVLFTKYTGRDLKKGFFVK